MTPDVTPPPPAIADYALLRLIGRGSYGDVWLAQGVTGVHRAVKIVWRARFTDAQPYEREFKGLREFARVSLEESRQLALLHVGRGEDFFYYVMELADDAATGREVEPARYVPHTLRETLARRGRLPTSAVLALAIDLARALAGLHTRGLVHRDIKPSNVIFVGGVPKLADIGLVATASAELTFVGTEGYVPPEGPGAPSADVFSLGKLLYELSTGLDRKDYPRLPADFHTFTDRKALLELNEVLIRACEPVATRRHTDASVLLEELLLLQAGKSVRRLRAAERHLGRALRVAAALAVIAAVAGTGAWIEHRRAAETEAARAEDMRKNMYSAKLTRAQRALETDEPGRARRLLLELAPKPGEADLRGFEWRALLRETQGDPAVIAAAGDIIKGLIISPDQRLVVGQVGDSRAVAWNTQTLAEVRTILGTRVLGGFSPDAGWLLGTNQSQALQRWRFSTGEADAHPAQGLHFPVGLTGRDQAWALLKDTRGGAVGLRLWDFGANREVAHIPISRPSDGNWFFLTQPALSLDGAWCAVTIGDEGQATGALRLQVYDLTARQLNSELRPGVRPSGIALSGDGRLVAMALTGRGAIALFEVSSGRLRWEQPLGVNIIDRLTFSPASDRLLVGGATNIVRVLDVTDGRPRGEYRGHDVGVFGLCWAGDGQSFFTADGGGYLRRWNADGSDGKVVSVRDGFWAENWADLFQSRTMCVSPDGTRFAAPESESAFRVSTTIARDPDARRIDGAFPLAFEANNERISFLTPEGVLQVRTLGQAAVDSSPLLLLPTSSRLACATLSTNGRVLVAGSSDGNLWAWTYPTREPLAKFATGQPFIWAVVSATGRTIAANGRDNVVHVWSVEGARSLDKISPGGARRAALGAAVSPDDHWLALGLETGEMDIRPLTAGGAARRFRTDSARLYAVTFSPDGTRLYCGGSNGVVQVYATDDWNLITTLGSPEPTDRHDNMVICLATSSSGNALLAYRADGTVRVWHTGEKSAEPPTSRLSL